MKKIKPSFIYPVLWLILCSILLVLPGRAFPQENWFDKIWLDKWVHIGLFAVMVFLWCWAYLPLQPEKPKRWTTFLFFAVLWLLYGTGMEFVQKYFVANRAFDVGDIIADGVGCYTGLMYCRWQYIKK